MPYRIAGIDVHKKMLAVVVSYASGEPVLFPRISRDVTGVFWFPSGEPGWGSQDGYLEGGWCAYGSELPVSPLVTYSSIRVMSAGERSRNLTPMPTFAMAYLTSADTSMKATPFRWKRTLTMESSGGDSLVSINMPPTLMFLETPRKIPLSVST